MGKGTKSGKSGKSGSSITKMVLDSEWPPIMARVAAALSANPAVFEEFYGGRADSWQSVAPGGPDRLQPLIGKSNFKKYNEERKATGIAAHLNSYKTLYFFYALRARCSF